jgi:phosphoglycerate dehydrogenase-like enzyme
MIGNPFRVGITRDFLKEDGTLGFGDIGLDLLRAEPRIEFEFLPERRPELLAAEIEDYDALLVLSPKITAASLIGIQRLKLIARFGVGYDTVDVSACTEQAVALTITPDGVRRPVAVSALTLILALTHRLLDKDRITRQGRWNEKLNYMGQGLTGRTLGILGLGNIGRELSTICAPLGMRHLAHDPYTTDAAAAAVGAELCSLETLLAESDFLVVCCALVPATHHLLNADRLALMKPTSYLINIARGPIVDQLALTIALQQRRIAGAGLDVFEREPIETSDALLQLDNVILSPHALCWTDELFAGIGRDACRSIRAVAAGEVPPHVVNREVLEQPKFRAKLLG